MPASALASQILATAASCNASRSGFSQSASQVPASQVLRQPDVEPLQQLLGAADLAPITIMQCLGAECDEAGDVAPLLRALFLGLAADDKRAYLIRVDVVFRMLETLNCSQVLSESQLNDCLSIVQSELATFDNENLYGMVCAMANSLKEPEYAWGPCRTFELLPNLLQLLANGKSYEVAGRVQDGAALRSSIIDTILSTSWHLRPLYKLLQVFRDIPLSEPQLQRLISKITRQFKKVPVLDAPTLADGLLKLSTKGNRVLIMRSLIKIFDDLDAQSDTLAMTDSTSTAALLAIEQLRQAEGTVLCFVDFQVKHDQKLGIEFLDDLKKHHDLTPFGAAVVLCLSRIQRFEEMVLCCHHHHHHPPSIDADATHRRIGVVL
jgi:hypothetical protein